ncbi:MAG: hypothetical protein JXJ20_04365 [Anaerolineae bacterium]|nr:hypothetical protein [Anaerolineae bacterium]
MADKLEAVADHLLVVGGRAVRVPPPGALVEQAPRRASHTREGDTFYILVTPSDETHAPSSFFETLARRAAEVYFSSGGGVTGGLREALGAINQQVLTNQPGPGERRLVNALALVKRDGELYAARSGRMFGVICRGADLTLFPADRRDPLVMNLPPLGAGPKPDIQLAHYTAAPGQVMLLSDAGLLEAADAALRTALSADGLPAILDQLKALAGPQASATVIRFVFSGKSEAAPAPGSVVTMPGASPPPPDSLPEIETSTPSAGPVRAGAADVPVLPGAEMQPFEFPFSDRVRPAFERVSATVSRVMETPIRRSAVAGDIARRVRKLGRDAVRAVLSGLLAVTNALTRALDTILPRPDKSGKQGIPTNIAIGLVVLIPVVIVVVVVGLWLSEQGKTDFEQYLEHAQQAHEKTLALSGGNCKDESLRPAWREVLRLADDAAKFRPDDLEVVQIRADARNYLDCYDGVQRRDVTLLHEFADGADLVGPIVNGGVDLYTLDRTAGAVYHDTLNENGDGVTSRDETPIIRRNQAIGRYVVGDLLDIEWLRSGGTVHDNVLIMLGYDGLLISYSPTFFASAQQLVIDGRWQQPVAMAVFGGNLYVLDVGANQVWRYVPTPGERRYGNAPEEYFTGEDRPVLSGAVDLGISEDEGAVYILFEDGTLHKYRRNIQGYVELQPFDYSQQPEGAITSGRALFLDNDPASRNLYIVDADNETIYETSWAGTFQRGYRPNPPNAFNNVSGIYADAVVRNNMYVVAGNKLYHFLRN